MCKRSVSHFRYPISEEFYLFNVDDIFHQTNIQVLTYFNFSQLCLIIILLDYSNMNVLLNLIFQKKCVRV